MLDQKEQIWEVGMKKLMTCNQQHGKRVMNIPNQQQHSMNTVIDITSLQLDMAIVVARLNLSHSFLDQMSTRDLERAWRFMVSRVMAEWSEIGQVRQWGFICHGGN